MDHIDTRRWSSRNATTRQGSERAPNHTAQTHDQRHEVMEMPKKTTKPQPKKTGRKFLSSVRPEKSFWINNGPIVTNIRNLPKALEQVSEDTCSIALGRFLMLFTMGPLLIQKLFSGRTLLRNFLPVFFGCGFVVFFGISITSWR